MRILVVDDTAIARTMLERTLKKWGYQVDTASNSEDAIALLRKEGIQFVITDWIMPGGDGPTLCRDIRALHLPFYTYIILVTSLESNESVIEALDAGADDFVRKPIQLEELHARIRSGERVLELEKALQERNEELSAISNNLLAAHDVIHKDLLMAAKMQHKLLPAKLATCLNVTIDWLFCPCSVVSGDIFNFFRLDESRIAFYALDVVGHGVSSAMLTLELSRLLMTPEIQSGSPLKKRMVDKPYYEIVGPADVMDILNSQFQTTTDNWLYFTMVYGVVNSAAQTIELTDAGHPNPIFMTAEQPARFVADGGFPIGIIETAEYETIVLNYQPGDRLILYSDGITECVGLNGEMFGQDRLLAVLEENKQLPLDAVSTVVHEHILAWRGGATFDDDVSMLILQMS